MQDSTNTHEKGGLDELDIESIPIDSNDNDAMGNVSITESSASSDIDDVIPRDVLVEDFNIVAQAAESVVSSAQDPAMLGVKDETASSVMESIEEQLESDTKQLESAYAKESQIMESHEIAKQRDWNTAHRVKQSRMDEHNQDDLMFDDLIFQKSYEEAKIRKYKWEYLVYSKRVFISLVCIVCFVGGYAMYLFFGSTSFEVLWDLHNTKKALHIEVEQSKLDNAALQRDVLELRALEPK